MKDCKMCRSKIDDQAKLCDHCGSDQRFILRLIKDTGLINIVSVIVLVLSYIQYDNARKEKILAEDANNSAQIALNKIESLQTNMEILAKLNAEVTFISTHRYSILASGAIVYPETFSNKLDSIMQMIEPNIDKYQKWIDELNKSK